MAGEILKGAVQGINQGISKSPFPNPVGTVASGVRGVIGGFKGYQKKQQAEASKALNKTKKQNAIATKQKQAQGKAYLNKLKAKLEGNNTPNLSPKKPVMSPSQGVAGQIGFKPNTTLPKVHIKSTPKKPTSVGLSEEAIKKKMLG